MNKIDSLTVKLHVDVKTLRDEFAMAALTGYIANNVFGFMTADELAKQAYWAADAMIEARKKGN